MRTNERSLFMMRQAATASTSLQCYQSLAARAYPGGQGVDAGTTLGAQIVGLVQSAAAHVGTVSFATQTPGFTFTPAAAVGPLDAPVTQLFDGALTVGADVAPGSYTVTVAAAGDSVPRATATIDVVVKPPALESRPDRDADKHRRGHQVRQPREHPECLARLVLRFGTGDPRPAPRCAADELDTGWLDSGGLDPGGLDPGRLDPRGLDPGRLDPGRLDSRRLDPGRLDPRRLDRPARPARRLDRPLTISSLLLSQLPLCGDVPASGNEPCGLQGRPRDLGRGSRRRPDSPNQPLNALSLADVLPNPTVAASSRHST